MRTKEIFVDIHVRFTQGQSIQKIARELGISRNTVKHHLQQEPMPTYTRRAPKQTKLVPFEPYLIQHIQLAKPDWIPANILFDELCQRGYQGAGLRNCVVSFVSLNPLLHLSRLCVLKRLSVSRCRLISPLFAEVNRS